MFFLIESDKTTSIYNVSTINCTADQQGLLLIENNSWNQNIDE